MALMLDDVCGMKMARRAEVLQVHPTSITNCVQRLEVDGLVRRPRSRSDGRARTVTTTADGAHLAHRATEELSADVFACLGRRGSEHEALLRLLTAFRRNAGDF